MKLTIELDDDALLKLEKKVTERVLDKMYGNKFLKEREVCEVFNEKIHLIRSLRKDGMLIPDQERPLKYSYTKVKKALEDYYNNK